MKFVSIAKQATIRTAVIAALISSALSAGATDDVTGKYRLPKTGQAQSLARQVAFRLPGHCVETTEVRTDGAIVTRKRCTLTLEQLARLKKEGR